MLGTRGVRLGPDPPRDLRDAGRARSSAPPRRARAHRPRSALEIMIPLVAYARELELGARRSSMRVAAEEGMAPGRRSGVGTMIELPRACLARRRHRARTPSSSRSGPTT